MKESEITTSLVRSLKRFFNTDEDINSAVINFIRQNPDATKAQIFNALVSEKGIGKAHHQGREEEFRPNHYTSKRKTRRRW
jgi:hypothetical protein